MIVLLIEDDPLVLELLKAYFETQQHRVVAASDGVQGIAEFEATAPDLLLLDIGLPRLDGWGVLEAVRRTSQVPVILLTALDDTESVVKGLALGADDYLSKPFQIKELDARIQAVMRRIDGRTSTGPGAGRIRIDDRRKTVTVGNRDLALSPKEFSLLQLLASDPGKVFSSDEIVAHLWPDSDRAAASDVKQYVHLLRSKLARKANLANSIENVKGFGYRLVV